MALLALAAALQDEAEALADLRGAGVDVSTYPRSARRGVTLASLLRLSAEGEPAAKLVHDYLDSGALRPGDLPAEVRHELSKAVA
jgi:hypothetical protein